MKDEQLTIVREGYLVERIRPHSRRSSIKGYRQDRARHNQPAEEIGRTNEKTFLAWALMDIEIYPLHPKIKTIHRASQHQDLCCQTDYIMVIELDEEDGSANRRKRTYVPLNIKSSESGRRFFMEKYPDSNVQIIVMDCTMTPFLLRDLLNNIAQDAINKHAQLNSTEQEAT